MSDAILENRLKRGRNNNIDFTRCRLRNKCSRTKSFFHILPPAPLRRCSSSSFLLLLQCARPDCGKCSPYGNVWLHRLPTLATKLFRSHSGARIRGMLSFFAGCTNRTQLLYFYFLLIYPYLARKQAKIRSMRRQLFLREHIFTWQREKHSLDAPRSLRLCFLSRGAAVAKAALNLNSLGRRNYKPAGERRRLLR